MSLLIQSLMRAAGSVAERFCKRCGASIRRRPARPGAHDSAGKKRHAKESACLCPECAERQRHAEEVRAGKSKKDKC